MDFICELIFEIVLEGVFGLTVKNPKVKTWTKTALFLLLSELIAAYLLYSGVAVLHRDNTEGGIVVIVMATMLAIGFVAGAIYGHKRDWKQSED